MKKNSLYAGQKINAKTTKEQQERIYRVYYCNQCRFFNLDAEERPADWSLKWKIGD